MGGARDELLAHAALAQDEHRGIAVRDLPNHLERRAQPVTLADDVLQAVAHLELALKLAVRGAQSPVVERLVHQRREGGDPG